jgi:predicted HTH transcriptional regulator
MEQLRRYITQGEGVTQDFKFRIDDQRKIARTLCAFANTQGGKLFIGVKDNGKIAGCNPEEEFHMIEGASQLYCSPAVDFNSRVWEVDFKLVLEIDVPESTKKYHTAVNDAGKSAGYLRVLDRTVEVGKIQRMVWREKAKHTSRPETFDEDSLRLLRLFQEDTYTLSKLYRLSGLPFKQVDKLVARFICWDLVEIVYDIEQTRYQAVSDIHKKI